MRKSFKLIVFISVMAIASLLLALLIAPIRGSFGEYSNNIKQKAFNAVAVNFNGANNGIGAVNSNRIESTIQLGSIKTTKSKVATNRSNNAASSTEMKGISYSLQAYVLRNRVVGSAGGAGLGSGVLANTSYSVLPNSAQGLIGINSDPNKNKSNTNGPALIGFNTLTTDLTGVGLSSGQGGSAQGAGGGPPPEEGGTGGSLPIGDGTSLMLVMAVVFVSWKALRFKIA